MFLVLMGLCRIWNTLSKPSHRNYLFRLNKTHCFIWSRFRRFLKAASFPRHLEVQNILCFDFFLFAFLRVNLCLHNFQSDMSRSVGWSFCDLETWSFATFESHWSNQIICTIQWYTIAFRSQTKLLSPTHIWIEMQILTPLKQRGYL